MTPGIFANSGDLSSPAGRTQTPVIYEQLQAACSRSNRSGDADRFTLTMGNSCVGLLLGLPAW